MTNFGEKVSACRQNRNMTQEELAGRLGITPQALSKWERGLSFPDIAMLADFSRLLNVSTDYLLGLKSREDREEYGAKTEEVQIEIGNNLRRALSPLEIVIGGKYIPLFMDSLFSDKIVNLKGIVPEKIHYTLLSEVVKKAISRGVSIVFLPKVIEIMCRILWDTPHATVDEMAEAIVSELS